nr:ribonuclease H-like domain-containing protein [Tanacetum cinerariifolium]
SFGCNDSSQQLGVDFNETFSPVVKPATIRPVLSLVVSPLLKQLIDSLHCEFDMTDLRAPVDTESKLVQTGFWFKILLCTEVLQGDLVSHVYTSRVVLCSSTYLPLYTRSARATFSCSQAYLAIYSRSTSGYCVFFETAWLRNLFREIHSPLPTATLVYCDNVSAVYMYANSVQHQRTKHIEIDIHFVCDMVIASQVRVLHVHSHYQYGIFTKGLPSALFEEF